MKNSDKIYEKDLYPPVKDYFEELGYTVKSEVKSCDIVAIKDDDMIITELKLSLNLDVILQAVQRQKMSQKVYIAVLVPKKSGKKFRNICDLLKRLGIGLILVYIKKTVSYVKIQFECNENNSNKISPIGKNRKKKLEKEFSLRHGDNNTGGVTREKLVTVYRENALLIAGLLQKHGLPLSAPELISMGAPKNAYDIMYRNHYRWFNKEGKGKYFLSEKGLDEILEFSDLIKVLLNQ